LLGLDLARWAKGIAERNIAEHKARHPALLNNVTGRPDDHGGNTGGFEGSCSQTHGLVADRSKRYEDGDVQLVICAKGHELAVVGRDAVVSRRDRTDPSRRGESRQMFEREEGTEIVGMCCVLVPEQIVGEHRGRHR